MIILAGTRCKFHFIQVKFSCKRKKWGKNGWKLVTLGGGGGGLTLNGKCHYKLPCFF